MPLWTPFRGGVARQRRGCTRRITAHHRIHPVSELVGGKHMFVGIDTHKDTLAVSCVDAA